MTYLASACPCCESSRHDAYPAVVSPFLASYALGESARMTRLLECGSCGFRFFEDRLTDAEAGRLYAGYRGDRYYEARHRHEPWYTRKVNDAIGGSEEVIRVRTAMVEKFLRDRADVAAIDDVLDFGGDRGQLIPQSIGARRFVYEISGTDAVPGVAHIGSAAELRDRRFDLVLLSHVLEHCSEPRAVLDEVRPLLRGEGSLLYVELPFERAELRWLGKASAYGSYLASLRRLGPLFTAVDLYSTLFRVRWNTMPPLGFLKMHEHLNFFDARSLRELLARSGFEAVAVEELVIRSSLGLTPVLSALARVRPTT
jgi:SAM-dependent methyltransferase